LDASWAGRYFTFSLTARQEQQGCGARVPVREEGRKRAGTEEKEREKERFERAPRARKQFKMMPRHFSNFKSEEGKRRIPVTAMSNAREYLAFCAM